MIGPSADPAPPIITPNSSRIDCRKGNELGLMYPCNGANREPASAIAAAEITKAIVRTRTRSMPIERVATSESLAARMA